jgi:hypothetical protein
LSRFVSRLSEKGLPLYKLKAMLAHAPILMSPQGGKPLYLYITATTQVVCAVIVVERTEEGHTLPVWRHVHESAHVGVLGRAQSRSLGTEGAKALP